jgi:prenyltransferase beta subunit
LPSRCRLVSPSAFQNAKDGGIGNRPGNMADVFTRSSASPTCRALLGFPGFKVMFKAVDPVYALPVDVVKLKRLGLVSSYSTL